MDINMLFDKLLDKVNLNMSLEKQEIKLNDGYIYRFDTVYESDYVTFLVGGRNYTIYRVSKWSIEDDFIDDLDLLIRQDTVYYDNNEMEYEQPFRVTEETMITIQSGYNEYEEY